MKVVKLRSGGMDRKRCFEKIVIWVMVGKNVEKLVRFVEEEGDLEGGGMG
ncbi:hypothetical protein ACRFB9_28285 [Klebsiella pneumoniae]